MHDDSDVFIRWKSQKEATRVPPAERGKRQVQNGITLFTKYSIAISSKAALEFRAYFNRFLLGTQATTAGSFSPALGLGGSLQGKLIPTSSLSIVYGSDFKFDKVKSAKSLYGQRDAILTAPYIQLEWQALRNLNLTLGGRYDRYEIYSDPRATFGAGRKYDHFSPKLGVNYRPFSGTTLRGSAANGFKFPVVAQLFLEFDVSGFTFRASPDLRSEESWTYELGWRQTITSTWFFEINGFYTDVEDLIEVVITPNLEAQFLNIEKARIPGIEFVTNARWWRNRLGLKANFLYMNPVDRVQNQLLPYRQKFIAFVAPSLRLGNFELQVDYKYASAQEVYQLSSFPQLVPQKVLDGRVFFYVGNHTFYVGVNNIGNYAYTLRDESLEEIRNFVAGFMTEL
ncbi:MAG: TonB-dependent receptor plug domain-containing protein [Desulfobacterales bacterium]